MTQALTLEDVKRIRVCAQSLRVLNSKHYGAPGVETERKRAQAAEEVADKIQNAMEVPLATRSQGT